jgi:hypothetical protein
LDLKNGLPSNQRILADLVLLVVFRVTHDIVASGPVGGVHLHWLSVNLTPAFGTIVKQVHNSSFAKWSKLKAMPVNVFVIENILSETAAPAEIVLALTNNLTKALCYLIPLI